MTAPKLDPIRDKRFSKYDLFISQLHLVILNYISIIIVNL